MPKVFIARDYATVLLTFHQTEQRPIFAINSLHILQQTFPLPTVRLLPMKALALAPFKIPGPVTAPV